MFLTMSCFFFKGFNVHGCWLVREELLWWVHHCPRWQRKIKTALDLSLLTLSWLDAGFLGMGASDRFLQVRKKKN